VLSAYLELADRARRIKKAIIAVSSDEDFRRAANGPDDPAGRAWPRLGWLWLGWLWAFRF
jgi:hypothetical protein